MQKQYYETVDELPTVDQLREISKDRPDTFLNGALYIIDLLEKVNLSNHDREATTTPVNGDKQEAKAKAKELVERFRFYVIGQTDGYAELQNAKQCAIICVDEIMKSMGAIYVGGTPYGFSYWESVKTEITNL